MITAKIQVLNKMWVLRETPGDLLCYFKRFTQGILQVKKIRHNTVYCELKPQLISLQSAKKVCFIKAWTSPCATPSQIRAKSEDPFLTGDERVISVWQWESYDQCEQGKSVCMPFNTLREKKDKQRRQNTTLRHGLLESSNGELQVRATLELWPVIACKWGWEVKVMGLTLVWWLMSVTWQSG